MSVVMTALDRRSQRLSCEDSITGRVLHFRHFTFSVLRFLLHRLRPKDALISTDRETVVATHDDSKGVLASDFTAS